MSATVLILHLLHHINAEYEGYSIFKGTKQFSWTDALNYCHSEGGDLVSIHSQQDMTEAITACGADRCWIGLSDSETEGTWRWSDGSSTDYGFNNNNASDPKQGYPWSYWQPDNWVEFEDCIELKNVTGEWNDVDCKSPLSVICRSAVAVFESEESGYLDTSVECSFDVNEYGDLLLSSYITVPKSSELRNKTYVLSNNSVYDSLPDECKAYPALEIYAVDELNTSNIKLYVQEAIFTDYLDVLNASIDNVTLVELDTDQITVTPVKDFAGYQATTISSECSNQDVFCNSDVFSDTISIGDHETGNRRRRLGTIKGSLSISPKTKIHVDAASKGSSVNFQLEMGADFNAAVEANFKCKFKIFEGITAFEFVMNVETTFKSYLNLMVNGSVGFDLLIIEVEKRFAFWIGPIPVVIRVYGQLYAGYRGALAMKLSFEAGYDTIYYSFGYKYTKKSGWNEIDNIGSIEFYRRFDNSLDEDDLCFWKEIKPEIQLRIGAVFYELVDIYSKAVLALPTDLILPGTCDELYPCEYSTTQLKIHCRSEFEVFIGVIVGPHFPYQIELEFPIYNLDVWEAKQCFKFPIAILNKGYCCNLEKATPAPVVYVTDSGDLASRIKLYSVYLCLIYWCLIAILFN